MTTVVSIQPRASGSSGGRSPDEIVYAMATDIESKLPEPLSKDTAHPVTFAKIDDGSMNSLVRVRVPCESYAESFYH